METQKKNYFHLRIWYTLGFNPLTYKSKPPCAVDSTTEKHHSVTFIWIDTLSFDLRTKKLEPPSIA